MSADAPPADALWLAAHALANAARMVLDHDGHGHNDGCRDALLCAVGDMDLVLANSYRPRGLACPNCSLFSKRRDVILTAGDGGINVECRGCGTKWMEDMSR